jgi:peroxiredoxin
LREPGLKHSAHSPPTEELFAVLPYLLVFSRIALGLLFAYSFVAKARDVAQFAGSIGRFELLPQRWTKPSARLFLGSEAAVVVLLILGGRLLPLAFALAGLLLLLFTLALLSALRRGIKTSCYCFGATDKPLTYYDVGRNAGFIACSLLGWWSAPQVAGSPAAQNWLALAWQGLVTVGSGDGLVTLLTINALLTWFILLPTAFFMLLLAKRFRQLDQGDPKELLLQEAGSRRGQPAPPFEAQNIGGETVTLDSFKGTDVAFIFLSPSCKPCVEKIPALNDYYRRGAANGMEMVIVNVDHHIAPKAFAQQHGVQLPILWAPQISNPFAHDYDAYSVPSFCLVDANQKIRAAGRLDSHYWQEQLALMWS